MYYIHYFLFWYVYALLCLNPSVCLEAKSQPGVSLITSDFIHLFLRLNFSIIYVWAPHGAFRGQRMLLGRLLRIIGSEPPYGWALGLEPRSSARATSALNHWVFSGSPLFWDRVLLYWNSSVKLSLLDVELQESSCLPSSGIASTSHPGDCYHCTVYEAQLLTLAWQALYYRLSCLPALSC